MHAAFAPLLARLIAIREERGLTAQDVETSLGQPGGWLQAFESGERELTLTALATILNEYSASFSTLFDGVELDLSAVTHREALALSQDGDDLVLAFEHGAHAATVRISNATVDEAREMLRKFANTLASKRPKAKSLAVAELMLDAVHSWPDANPSDISLCVRMG